MDLREIFREGNRVNIVYEGNNPHTLLEVHEDYVVTMGAGGVHWIHWTLEDIESTSSVVNDIIHGKVFIGKYHDVIKLLKELQDNSNICWRGGDEPLNGGCLKTLKIFNDMRIAIFGHGTYITFSHIQSGDNTEGFINLSTTDNGVWDKFSPEQQRELTQLLEEKHELMTSNDWLGSFDAHSVGVDIPCDMAFQFTRRGLDIIAEWNGELYGCAKCRITDTFDTEKGLQLAYLRALSKYSNTKAKQLAEWF